MKSFWKNLLNSNINPVINILIRTSNRPNYFKTCIDSVYKQSYKNIRVFVSYDDPKTYEYLKLYKGIKTVHVFPITEGHPKMEIQRDRQMQKFPANLYLNDLMSMVSSGYIIILDDDDCFTNQNSIQTIVDHISDKDDLLFWRVQFPNNRLVPEDEHFGKPPALCHVSGIGFAFNHKYIKNAKWDGWKGGDFVVATKLFDIIPNKVYINKILTGLQRKNKKGGLGKRIDKKPEPVIN